jgi:hypothetical protein
MRTTSSQVRERLEDSGRTLIALHLNGRQALLNYNGSCELWELNDDADCVIEIDGKKYEFVRTEL